MLLTIPKYGSYFTIPMLRNSQVIFFLVLCGVTCLLRLNGVIASKYAFKECVAWYRLVDTSLTTIVAMGDFQYIVAYSVIHFIGVTFLCYVGHYFGLRRLSSFCLSTGNCWSKQLVVFVRVANFFGLFPCLGGLGKLLRVFICFRTNWHFPIPLVFSVVFLYCFSFSFFAPNIGGYLSMRVIGQRSLLVPKSSRMWLPALFVVVST